MRCETKDGWYLIVWIDSPCNWNKSTKHPSDPVAIHRVSGCTVAADTLVLSDCGGGAGAAGLLGATNSTSLTSGDTAAKPGDIASCVNACRGSGAAPSRVPDTTSIAEGIGTLCGALNMLVMGGEDPGGAPNDAKLLLLLLAYIAVAGAKPRPARVSSGE